MPIPPPFDDISEFFTDLASQLLWALFYTASVAGKSMNDVVRWVLLRDRPRRNARGDVAAVLDKELVGDDAQRRRWAGDAFHALEGGVGERPPHPKQHLRDRPAHARGVAGPGRCQREVWLGISQRSTSFVPPAQAQC